VFQKSPDQRRQSLWEETIGETLGNDHRIHGIVAIVTGNAGLIPLHRRHDDVVPVLRGEVLITDMVTEEVGTTMVREEELQVEVDQLKTNVQSCTKYITVG